MAGCNSKNIYQDLLAVDGQLGKEEVESLKFLCSDLIFLKKLESVESARDLFDLLIKEDVINKEDMFFVAELLYRIREFSLLRKFGFSKEDVERDLPSRGKVSDYRQMLLEISADLTMEDLESTKFLMRDQLPKGQLIKNTLEILVYLEKQDLLADNKLDLLEEICSKISPELRNKVTLYKERQAINQTKVQNISKLSLRQSYGENELKFAIEESVSYKMDGPCRGVCLVFNNEGFKGPELKKRIGSEKDANELERVFKWLGLDVHRYDDKTSEEMKELLQQWQSYKNWKDTNCLVCCILSHGKSGQIYGTDEVLISIHSIMSYFTAKQCPQLAEKPKLFFIQACQGHKKQGAFFLESDSGDTVPLVQDAQSSGGPISSQSIVKSSIPEEADFLLGMATVDGCLSFRNIREGTWYIQALCTKLQELVPRGEDVLSILTAVNADVSTRIEPQGRIKQMPQPAYTLRKKIIFPVPTSPRPPLSEQQ